MRFAGQRERDRARQPCGRQSPGSRVPLAAPKPADKGAGEGGSPGYFALMMTVFMNASPMLSDVASPRSATAMCTMRRS